MSLSNRKEVAGYSTVAHGCAGIRGERRFVLLTHPPKPTKKEEEMLGRRSVCAFFGIVAVAFALPAQAGSKEWGHHKVGHAVITLHRPRPGPTE